MELNKSNKKEYDLSSIQELFNEMESPRQLADDLARSVLYLLSRQDIGTSIAPLGIALIDSILLVFTRPNRDTIIFAYQLAFM